MNRTARRWFSIDGLAVMVLAAAWAWFALLMIQTIRHMAQVPGPTDPTRVASHNPVLILLALTLIAGSVAITAADHFRRHDRLPAALVGMGLCALAGLGFVGLQVYRFSEPAFASTDFHGLLLWQSADLLSIHLLIGLCLLVMSAILMLARPNTETPSLIEQATTWHWHTLDTGWLILITMAWQMGAMEAL